MSRILFRRSSPRIGQYRRSSGSDSRNSSEAMGGCEFKMIRISQGAVMDFS